MKILHLVAAPTLTGPADPALGIARGQRALGHDVRIGFDTHRTGTMAARVAAAGVPPVEGLVLSTKAGLGAALADRARLRALAREVDVVHVHDAHSHTLAVLAGGAPVVRSIHHARGCRRRGLQGWIYGRTARFFCVAEAHAGLLRDAYPRIDAERIAVVPGAIDEARFQPVGGGDAVRAAQGIDPSAFAIGLVARIKPGRGHRLLLEAMAEVRGRHPTAVVGLVGKGEGVDEVRAAVAALGLEDAVRWYGFRTDDLPQVYASFDVTVLLEEGNDASCRAVLESMGCAIPVIGADHPAIADALRGDSGGVVFRAGDRSELVAALEAALAWTAEERAQRGAQARARILDDHTDRVRAERVLAHYPRGAP